MAKIKTSITLNADTHARMLEQAAKEHRSISNMVESVIEKIFGRSKKPAPAATIAAVSTTEEHGK